MIDDQLVMNNKVMNNLLDDLKSQGLTGLKEKLCYVRKNYNSQMYLAFASKEINDVILQNYHKSGDSFEFSRDSVDGILRSFYFAITNIPVDLPEENYDYILSKSNTFFLELINEYKKIEL